MSQLFTILCFGMGYRVMFEDFSYLPTTSLKVTCRCSDSPCCTTCQNNLYGGYKL